MVVCLLIKMAFHIDTHDREHVGVIFFFWALSKSW